MPNYDATPPTTLGGLPSLTASRASLHSITIGDGSFSSGDVFVESILPKVRFNAVSPQSATSKPTSRDQPTPFQPPSKRTSSKDQPAPEIEVLRLADHPSVLQAQAECATLLNGNDVSVLEDEDVKEDVVQIMGADAELVFPCRNIFRYLVLFLKDMERYVELHVDLLDDKQVYRHIKVTNARSLAKVEPNHAQLPMVVGKTPGWRYVCLDLPDLTRRAFGSKHVTTTRLRVLGQCRLLRIFFQDEQYGDGDLPPYLSFLG